MCAVVRLCSRASRVNNGYVREVAVGKVHSKKNECTWAPLCATVWAPCELADAQTVPMNFNGCNGGPWLSSARTRRLCGHERLILPCDCDYK